MDTSSLTFLINTLKVISVLIFGSLFINSAIETWEMFRSGLTTSTRSIVPIKSSEGLKFPVLVVCNKTGFKSNVASTKMEDFIEDTLDFEDMIEGIDSVQLDGRFNFTTKTVYSAFGGRCYAIQIDNEVHRKNSEYALISLKNEVEVLIYTLEPGFEFFIALEYWIEQPIRALFGKTFAFYDFFISKEIKYWRPTDCFPMNSTEYISNIDLFICYVTLRSELHSLAHSWHTDGTQLGTKLGTQHTYIGLVCN